MGIEATRAELKGNEFSELAKETGTKTATAAFIGSNIDRTTPSNSAHTNSNHKVRKSKRRPKKMVVSRVQTLYNTCKEVFSFCGSGIVPSQDDIDRLRSVLDEIKPADVGLTSQMPYFGTSATRRIPAITYLHLHECDKFSMGIFCLPPSGVIPLHNHPGMTVFSKLLFGTMHIKSYDWAVDVPGNTSAAANLSKRQHPDVRLAKLKVDSDFTAPCNTSILFPADGGNMHCFTAVTACAVLDVLGPPYSDPEGRPCTYYLDFPFDKFSVDGVSVSEEEKDGYAWLKEREERPVEFAVVGAMYKGPKIVEN